MQKIVLSLNPQAYYNFLKSYFLLAVVVVFAFTAMSFRYKNYGGPKTETQQGISDTVKGFKTLLNSRSADSNEISGHFELNPKAIPFVKDFISKQGDDLEKMKTWGMPYFALYEKILSANGLPVELKYLSVIESSLQADDVSYAGAVGPWQLMPDEAKRYGLKVTSHYDERMSFSKSTVAASKLLKELYNQFGDWLLVIAAYNAGVGGVNRAISRSGSKNFWDLQSYLPEQTRNHVKKYIATHYFFEGCGGWTTLTASESAEMKTAIENSKAKVDSTTLINTETLSINGKFNSVVVANTLLIDIAKFNELNPLFDKILSEGNYYMLTLPTDRMVIFRNKRQEILYQSVQLLLSGAAGQPATSSEQ